MSQSELRDPVGFLGAGELTAAIVRGLNRPGQTPPPVLLSPRGRAVGAALEREFDSVRVCASNAEVVSGAALLVVAVRPAQVADVLRALPLRPEHVVVSVAAGVRRAELHPLVAPAHRVVRAIPHTTAALGQSLTALHPADPAAIRLLERVGEVVVTDTEAGLDAFSAASATMAAHLDYVDAVATWLAGHGVEAAFAARYVRQVLGRVGESLLDPAASLDELARSHTTPGGINEQFRAALRRDGSREAITRGLDAVLDRLRPDTEPVAAPTSAPGTDARGGRG